MERYKIFLILLTFFHLNVYSVSLENYAVNQLDEVNLAIETLGQPHDPCPVISSFKNPDEMINSICSESQSLSQSDLKDLLERRGAKEILKKQGITFEDFFENFVFFNKQNTNLGKLIDNSLGSQWKLSSPTNDDFSFWQNRLKQTNEIMPLINLNTKSRDVPFIAANHLYRLEQSKHSIAKNEIKEHFEKVKPKAIVIEGFEVGQALPCTYVLSKVFEPDEIINSEVDYAMKIAFNQKVAIIPGDSQSIDDVDKKIQSRYSDEELEKLKEELKIIDFLHMYYSNLRNGTVSPFDETINQLNGQGIDISGEEVRSTYKDLNNRDLPNSAQEIYNDFTPPKYLRNPRGTNLIVSKQDDLRNQGLLSAIQMGLNEYGKIMVIYGSGHLPEVAPTIQNY